MKNLIITEEEKSRILGMHKSATSRQYLMEQSGTTQPQSTGSQPQLGGDKVASVMSIPGYKNFIKWNQNSQKYGFEAKTFETELINYLGGQGSNLSGIIGKTILITKQKMYDYLKMERFALENNSVNNIIIGSFVPKSWYVGSDRDLKNKTLYLFNKEITTNYSGDINKPFIEKDGNSEYDTDNRIKAGLMIPTRNVGGNGLPYVDDNNDIVKTLWTTGGGLNAGTDYIRIRLYDGYCIEYKGYADYLLYLGIPPLGSMAGVTKVK